MLPENLSGPCFHRSTSFFFFLFVRWLLFYQKERCYGSEILNVCISNQGGNLASFVPCIKLGGCSEIFVIWCKKANNKPSYRSYMKDLTLGKLVFLPKKSYSSFCANVPHWRFAVFLIFLYENSWNIIIFCLKTLCTLVLDLKSQQFSKSVVYDKSYYQKLGFVPFSQKLHLSVRDARIILDLYLQMRFQGLFHLNFPIPYDVSSQINPVASHFQLKYFLKWVCTVQ